MFLRQFQFLLIVCTLQVSLENHHTSLYDDCKKNPKKVANDYAEKHKDYMVYIAELRLKHMELIDKPLSHMKTDPDCIEKDYRDFTSVDYVYKGYYVCGVSPLRHNYEPPLKHSKNLTDEEICNFFEVNGAIGIYLMPKNINIELTCRPDVWFKRIFYKAWKECHERKEME